MATKSFTNLLAPDGSEYVTLTDGAGNLLSGPSGGQITEGTVASGSADSGNPVKVGGKYNVTLPVFVDGNRGDLQIDVDGNLRTNSAYTQSAGADAIANNFNFTLARNTQVSTNSLTAAGNYIYNSATWDRIRSLGGGSQTVTTGMPITVSMPHTAANAGIISTATATANSAQILKASAGNLYSVSCTSGASAGFLMVFDAVSAPADGVVTPIDVITVAANATVSKMYPTPLRGAVGLTLVFSTTGPFSKTASATAFLAGQVV